MKIQKLIDRVYVRLEELRSVEEEAFSGDTPYHKHKQLSL